MKATQLSKALAEQGKSASEIATALLEQGERDYIGSGIIVERASKRVAYPLVIGGPIEQPAELWASAELCHWVESYYVTLDGCYPIQREWKAKPDSDSSQPSYIDSTLAQYRKGKPGSIERQAAYAQAIANDLTPFAISDNQIATRLAQALIEYNNAGIVEIAPQCCRGSLGVSKWQVASTIEQE